MEPGAGDAGRRWAAEPDFWHRVAEQLGTALTVIDAAGRIVAANPAAELLLDRPAAAMRGADVHDLLHRGPDGGRIPRDQCPLLQALARGTAVRGDGDYYLRGDGALTAVSWSASPLTDDGSQRGIALLLTDIATDTAADRGARRERTAYTSALEDLTERLTLVAEITDVLGQTLETDEALARLGRLLVPRLADWAAVDLLTGSGQVHRVAVTGPAGRDTARGDWRGPLPKTGRAALSPLARVLNGGEPVLQKQDQRHEKEKEKEDKEQKQHREQDENGVGGGASLDAVHGDFLRTVGATSVLTVPMGAHRQVTGALTLVRTSPAHPFDAGDLEVVGDIGRRVGLVIDNARRYGRQRAVAEAMQRNLLAPLPRLGPLRLAARYQPAPAGSQVGGDWYDAFGLRDGALALVIGDVVGHDLTAAAGMAQLHGVLRSLAWDRTEPPGAVIDRLDDAMQAVTTVSMATLVLARVEGPRTGPWTLRWTSAGHPPPLLLTPDGGARYLEAGQGLLLGARLGSGGHRPDATVALPPGSTLLLYTDGLVEVPGSDLDTGLGRLRRNALALVHEPLDTLCDEVLARRPPGSTDDIALLALRLPAP
ncbi:DNA-binding protein [Streptomyces pactum]|uniref:protein-serine/threonine phosphatase n=1 Tax=Streptomyces pactum TaxID=68249 RepID=A0A1S6JJW7_9ACTN|nr:DNA-binding protein [Streptomyces pactum]